MRDLTQDSVTRHVLHLAVFLALSMVFQTLYYLVDLYFVSRLGKEAIAGVGLAGNWMLIGLALTQMLGVGTTVLISHAAGRKDQPRAQMVFNQSFVLVGAGGDGGDPSRQQSRAAAPGVSPEADFRGSAADGAGERGGRVGLIRHDSASLSWLK